MFIKLCVAFVFRLQALWMIDFTKIYQFKGLKPKNKGHMNFYECCDLTEKVYLTFYFFFKFSSILQKSLNLIKLYQLVKKVQRKRPKKILSFTFIRYFSWELTSYINLSIIKIMHDCGKNCCESIFKKHNAKKFFKA